MSTEYLTLFQKLDENVEKHLGPCIKKKLKNGLVWLDVKHPNFLTALQLFPGKLKWFDSPAPVAAVVPLTVSDSIAALRVLGCQQCPIGSYEKHEGTTISCKSICNSCSWKGKIDVKYHICPLGHHEQ